jgi:hypothetical protein
MAINLQKFRKSLIYQLNSNISKIYNDLNEIKKIDQQAEKEQARFAKLGWQCFGAGFICGVLGILINFYLTVLAVITPLLFLSALILVLFAIYYWMQSGIHGRLNIPNYRYELARKVVLMLSRDMDKSLTASLSVDFNSNMQERKVVQTLAHPHRSGWKIKKFQDCWLQFGGELLDQTVFKLTIMESNQVVSGYKRSASGKSKYKSKTKGKGVDINLVLKYSPRKYAAIKLLQDDVNTAIQLPQAATLKQVRITDKNIALSVKASPAIAANVESFYQIIAMMFLSCYHILNLARILSKKS